MKKLIVGKILLTIFLIQKIKNIDYSGRNIVEIFDKKAKITYNVDGPFITIKFTSLNNGYLAISFGNKMCPGDVIIVSHERSPKILDSYCKRHLSDAKEDYIFGGKNSWEILSSKKEKGKGYVIEARRMLVTGDGRLDHQFVRDGNQAKFISWAYSEEEHDFRVDCDHSGVSSLAKIYQEFDL